MKFNKNWIRFEKLNENCTARVVAVKMTKTGKDYLVLDLDDEGTGNKFLNISPFHRKIVRPGQWYEFSCTDVDKNFVEITPSHDPSWIVHDESHGGNLMDIPPEEETIISGGVDVNEQLIDEYLAGSDARMEELAHFLQLKLREAERDVSMYSALLESVGWK